MEALKFNIETFNNEKKYNDLKVFDCSDLVINKYVKDNLKKQNVRNNVKTLVLTKNSDSVIGFVTVNLFQLSKEVVPSTIFSFSLPPKIGVMKISMLAVDKKYQKNGWGLALMKAAFDYILSAADIIPDIKGVYIDAKENAEKFYARLGFIAISDKNTENGTIPMFLSIDTLRAAQ